MDFSSPRGGTGMDNAYAEQLSERLGRLEEENQRLTKRVKRLRQGLVALGLILAIPMTMGAFDDSIPD
jgi:hypothetical protein